MAQPILHSDSPECWPAIRLADWKDTYATLHMWTQIVGKIRLQLTPKVNHWWNVTLYVNSRGFTTSLIPCDTGAFEIQFNFVDHRLEISKSGAAAAVVKLEPKPVRAFYQELMSSLHS